MIPVPIRPDPLHWAWGLKLPLVRIWSNHDWDQNQRKPLLKSHGYSVLVELQRDKDHIQ